MTTQRRGRPPVEINVTVIGRPCDAGLEAIAMRIFKMVRAEPNLRLVGGTDVLQKAEKSL